MDRRRLLLILAVFVALIGTALVFLYVKSASKVTETTVYVAATNITRQRDLGHGCVFRQGRGEVRPSVLRGLGAGRSDDHDQHQGRGGGHGAALRGPADRRESVQHERRQAAPTPSTLPIPKGMIAISVNLTDPDRVAGNIENGSQVAIFVTGELAPAGGAAAGGAAGAAATTTTRLLLPKVTVLNVGSPQPPTTSTKTDPNGTQTTEQLPRTLLTLAVTQKEAQKVIVSSKALNLTFGLLTNTSVVHPGPGTSTLVASLFR